MYAIAPAGVRFAYECSALTLYEQEFASFAVPRMLKFSLIIF